MGLTAERYLKIDPEMIREIATGLEEGDIIAARYGLTGDEWEVVSRREDFQNAVARARADVLRGGEIFRQKAAAMADALLDNMFKASMGSDIPVKDKAAALQILTKVGELEPRQSASAQGGGFSITISLPATPSRKEEAIVVEAQPVDKGPAEPPVLDMEFKNERAE